MKAEKKAVRQHRGLNKMAILSKEVYEGEGMEVRAVNTRTDPLDLSRGSGQVVPDPQPEDPGRAW